MMSFTVIIPANPGRLDVSSVSSLRVDRQSGAETTPAMLLALSHRSASGIRTRPYQHVPDWNMTSMADLMLSCVSKTTRRKDTGSTS